MVNSFTFEKLETSSVCKHAVSMKDSSEAYTFSMALHTGEEEKKVVENRMKFVSVLGWDEKMHFVTAKQTHSTHIRIIETNMNLGWETFDSAVEDCDALITNQKNLALCIVTADCVPILLCDTKQRVIAAVHAGWKGTKEELVLKTVEKMIRYFHCDPQDIIAGIAPAIGRCCYEVGKDVAQHFYHLSHTYDKNSDKYMLDLPLINREQLLSAGLKNKNIEMSGICTSCDVEHFFSYRKEQGCAGRFMSMISLC